MSLLNPKLLNSKNYIDVLRALDELRVLLSPDGLYVHRANGMIEASVDEDPMMCRYVRKIFREMFPKDEEFDRLIEIVKYLHSQIPEEVSDV